MAHEDLPFSGVRVLDLSQGVAGPYCGMHFARNGADVVKLEPPGTGCWSRQLGKAIGDQTAHFVVVHRQAQSRCRSQDARRIGDRQGLARNAT